MKPAGAAAARTYLGLITDANVARFGLIIGRIAAGDYDAAWHITDELMRGDLGDVAHRAIAVRMEVAARTGHLRHADRWLRLFDDTTDTIDSDLPAALRLRSHALVDDANTERAFRSAALLLEQLSAPGELARTYLPPLARPVAATRTLRAGPRLASSVRLGHFG